MRWSTVAARRRSTYDVRSLRGRVRDGDIRRNDRSAFVRLFVPTGGRTVTNDRVDELAAYVQMGLAVGSLASTSLLMYAESVATVPVEFWLQPTALGLLLAVSVLFRRP